MRRRRKVGIATTLALCAPIVALAAAALADPRPRALGDGDPPAKESPRQKAEDCVDVTTEARFRNFAYDHIVHIDNGCDDQVACTVSTDVNPEEKHVQVAAGKRKSIITFSGSPARTFKADVDCTLPQTPRDDAPRK